MPKQNAMGTPAIRHAATKTTRKRMILLLPSLIRDGERYHSRPAIRAMTSAETIRLRHVDVRRAYARTMLSMATMPKGMAAARKVLGISSAAVVMYHSSIE